MSEAPEFGDRMPLPPTDTKAPDSSRALGRFLYGVRAKWLHATHRKYPPSCVPPPVLVKKLLVIQVERIGDLVLAEPALRALRKHYADSERVLVAPAIAKDLFAGSGWGIIKTPDYFDELLKHGREYDMVVDLTGRLELKIARMLKRAQIPVRVGFERGGRGVWATHTVPIPPITVPTRELYLHLTNYIGAPSDDAIPRLPCGQDRIKRGKNIWKEMGFKRPVVIMPGAHYAEQRWSIENFATVGKTLRGQGIEVAVICGPGEEEMGIQLAGEIKVPLFKAPPMTALLDALSASSVVVCNNTGPLHIACALGVPTVSTMGPTVPWRWWPKGDKPAIVFRGGEDGPVGNLEQIDPAEVAAATLHLLG